MSDINVEDKILMRPINTIKPYIRNPRKNDKTVDALVKIIPKVGFNVPIVIDDKGIIVKGHARFTAAIRLGMTEVPCIISHASPEAIKADRITDNKISEFSSWINADLIEEINNMDFDLSDIGLPQIDLSEVPSIEQLREAEMYQQHLNELSKATSGSSGNDSSDNAPIPVVSPDDSVDEIEADFKSMVYYKCVCEKCGYVMFIKEGEI